MVSVTPRNFYLLQLFTQNDESNSRSARKSKEEGEFVGSNRPPLAPKPHQLQGATKSKFVNLDNLKFTFGSQSVSGYLDLISLQEEELDKMYKAFSADYPRGGMFRT